MHGRLIMNELNDAIIISSVLVSNNVLPVLDGSLSSLEKSAFGTNTNTIILKQ